MRYNRNKDSCCLVIIISVAIGNKKLALSLSELQMGQIKAKTCCHNLYICRQNAISVSIISEIMKPSFIA